VAGVYDFVARFTDETQLKLQARHALKKKTNGAWIGTPFSEDDTDWKAASAVTQVDDKDPPVLLLHSKDDRTVPWPQSRDMHSALVKAGVAGAKIHLSDKGGHGGPPDSMARMIDFFRLHLAEKTEP